MLVSFLTIRPIPEYIKRRKPWNKTNKLLANTLEKKCTLADTFPIIISIPRVDFSSFISAPIIWTKNIISIKQGSTIISESTERRDLEDSSSLLFSLSTKVLFIVTSFDILASSSLSIFELFIAIISFALFKEALIAWYFNVST